MPRRIEPSDFYQGGAIMSESSDPRAQVEQREYDAEALMMDMAALEVTLPVLEGFGSACAPVDHPQGTPGDAQYPRRGLRRTSTNGRPIPDEGRTAMSERQPHSADQAAANDSQAIGRSTFGEVIKSTGWRVELFWNGAGGWFTARMVSPWNRDGVRIYPGGYLVPFDDPIGASGVTPEEAVANLSEAVLEWA